MIHKPEDGVGKRFFFCGLGEVASHKSMFALTKTAEVCSSESAAIASCIFLHGAMLRTRRSPCQTTYPSYALPLSLEWLTFR